MTDREKAIKTLESILDADIYDYWLSGEERKSVCDAIVLLKEQDAKPPAIMQDIEGIWSTCSMCGHKLRPILAMEMDTYFPKFCSECGQAVKWE